MGPCRVAHSQAAAEHQCRMPLEGELTFLHFVFVADIKKCKDSGYHTADALLMNTSKVWGREKEDLVRIRLPILVLNLCRVCQIFVDSVMLKCRKLSRLLGNFVPTAMVL